MTDNPLYDAEGRVRRRRAGTGRRGRETRAKTAKTEAKTEGKTEVKTETTGDERVVEGVVKERDGRRRPPTSPRRRRRRRRGEEARAPKSTPRAVEDATETKKPQQRERKQRPRDSVTSPIPSRKQEQQRQSRQPTSGRKARRRLRLPVASHRRGGPRDWLSSHTRTALRMENSLWAWVRADGGRELIHELKESMSCGASVTIRCARMSQPEIYLSGSSATAKSSRTRSLASTRSSRPRSRIWRAFDAAPRRRTC